MKPLNQQERQKSFLNFLLLFVITIVIMLTTVFFSYQVPLHDNEKLRQERDIAGNEKIFLQSFEIKMDETSRLLDSVNLPGNGSFRMDNQIKNNIDKMAAMALDSAAPKGLCDKIIDSYLNLKSAKKELRDINNSNEELVKKDKEIESLKADNRMLLDRIDRLSSPVPRN